MNTSLGIQNNDNSFNKGEIDKQGNYIKKESKFREFISNKHPIYKPENKRYHLYVSYACPFASRVLMVRSLKGLEDCIDISIVNFILDKSIGWTFSDKDGCTIDKVNNYSTLKQVYLLSNPDYNDKITVPVLFDKKTKTIVNNESGEIIKMLNDQFNEFAKNSKLDLYPLQHRSKIDEINNFIHENINIGVYKCGFAESQQSYEIAFNNLFKSLDQVEELLKYNRYLLECSDYPTEADFRLFATLIRFDAVYYTHFKCNKKQIKDYPMLLNYTRELYQINGIRSTVNMDHIKKCYYLSQKQINPFGIVPLGPDLSYLDESHNRHLMSKYY